MADESKQLHASLFECYKIDDDLKKMPLPLVDYIPVLACCCPCVLTSAIHGIINGQPEAPGPTTFLSCCCSCNNTEYQIRRKLRFIGDMDYKGEKAANAALIDCLSACVCWQCMVVQDLKEVVHRKEQIALAAGKSGAGAIAGKLFGK